MYTETTYAVSGLVARHAKLFEYGIYGLYIFDHLRVEGLFNVHHIFAPSVRGRGGVEAILLHPIFHGVGGFSPFVFIAGIPRFTVGSTHRGVQQRNVFTQPEILGLRRVASYIFSVRPYPAIVGHAYIRWVQPHKRVSLRGRSQIPKDRIASIHKGEVRALVH